MITRTLAATATAVATAIIISARVASAAPDDARSIVSTAEHAFEELRYDEALRLLDDAWHRGGSSPTALRGIFALAGQAAGSIGDEDNARLWFSRWLCIEPEAELPGGTSPKLTALLGDARTALAGASIGARVVRGQRTISVVDPLALVSAARIDGTRAPVRAGVATFDAPIDQPIELVDRYGNVLVRVEPQTPIEDVPRLRRQWYERPINWSLATAGFAAVSGGALWFALDARSQIADLNRTSPNHEFTEAKSLEQRFDRANLVAEVALGGAVITAALATVMWLRGEPGSTIVSPAGAAVAWQF